jgi:excinuclease ABC subunit C
MERPKNLPSKPGVYVFKDDLDKIIYIGKAKDLNKRVSSYFLRGPIDRPWAQVMVGLIKSVETYVVGNETEALMLEATLIKQHQPRFNILLTDDKSYPYIKLIENETIPRFMITRKQIVDGSKYFGPYLSARSASFTLELLRSLYGVHISHRPLATNQKQPCFNCQLLNTPCPQAGQVEPQAYRIKISQAVEVLQGKRKKLVIDLKKQMSEAAKTQNFELAARLRDFYQSLERVQTEQHVISTRLGDYDVVGLSRHQQLANVVVLSVREGRLIHQEGYFLQILGDEKDEEILSYFLSSILATSSFIAPEISLPQTLADMKAVASLLSESTGHPVKLIIPERGDKKNMLELARKNAENRLELKLLQSGKGFESLIALQELLSLSNLPERIEAVDISNLGTSEAVGATVCFINGVPDKNEYRRYKIKTVEGQNDFAMIQEIVTRRFNDTSRSVPDLFIVDGGPEQLAFALKGLKSSLLQPKKIASLAKKPDRIFLPDKKTPLIAKRGHQGLRLMSEIRDEVHRFGIKFQRSRQLKKSLES